MNEPHFYLVSPSAFGSFSIVWRQKGNHPRVYRLFLSNERASAEELAQAAFPGARYRSHPVVADLSRRIQGFLAGQAVRFELDWTALEVCSEFQRRVLIAEYGIPRGWVSTYGRIGAHLGVKRGARVVGGALARNPFPILIPCHRAIRSNGELGGYQGGLQMKRALLQYEGLEVSERGRVLTPKVYY